MRLKPVADVWSVPAYPVKLCCYPGCFTELGERNISAVCRKHIHKLPYCDCGECVSVGTRQRLRVKTRKQMVKEGLLFE